MKSHIAGFAMLITSSAAAAMPQQATDFGVRVVPGASPSAPVSATAPAAPATAAAASTSLSLSSAVLVASKLGRVTSTRRSVARNRAVGGVRNSFHLSGRALDVVPRAGVRHADIDAALRRAGFHLLESLDEGDHSHFAFGTGSSRVRAVATAPAAREVTQWRMVSAPRIASR